MLWSSCRMTCRPLGRSNCVYLTVILPAGIEPASGVELPPGFEIACAAGASDVAAAYVCVNASARSMRASFMARFYPWSCVRLRDRLSFMRTRSAPLVGIIMGSKSDWEAMRQADEVLTQFDVPHESRVLSAHRTPALTAEYASGAMARGLQVIIAGAGGAAHLAGVVAAHTILPVIG